MSWSVLLDHQKKASLFVSIRSTYVNDPTSSNISSTNGLKSRLKGTIHPIYARKVFEQTPKNTETTNTLDANLFFGLFVRASKASPSIR